MNLKQQAAKRALDFVESNMTLGLGTGSTTAYFIDLLGAAIQAGRLHHIRAVPTSEWTADRARELGIPLATLSQVLYLDLAVDGADEIDPNLNLIKGLGYALLREKVVEIHARRFVVIADDSKLCPRLGTKGPLPVEMVRFEADAHLAWLNTLNCRAEYYRRQDGSIVVSDNNNYLALCHFAQGIDDPYRLARQLADRPGIVEHGLFLDMATEAIVAGSDGIRLLERSR